MIPYLLLLLLVIILSYKGEKKRLYRVLLFAVMALFVGLRKDVGTDYENYTNMYYFQADYLETGYTYIINFLYRYGFGVEIFFFTMAVISYIFMFFSVEINKEFQSFPSLVMLSICTMSFLCNGVRQGVAVCIFLFSYYFIKERRIIPFLLCIALAFLFHKSIILVLPLYYLNIAFNKKIYFITYAISFVFVTMSLNDFVEPFMPLINESSRYTVLAENDSGEGYLSLGIILGVVNYGLVIIFALKNNIQKQFPVLFNLCFIAAVVMNMRIGAPLMVRILVIFSWFIYVIVPIIVRKDKKFSDGLTIFFILSYTMSTIKYYFFDSKSDMYPYHDVFGIF